MQVECLIIVPGIHALTSWRSLTGHFEFPRGALSLGSFLEAKGCSVAILPLDYYIWLSEDPRDIERQVHKIVEAALKEYNPLLVGISVPYTILYPISLKIAKSVKKIQPDVVIALGGGHVSFQDRRSFEDSDAIDIVVRGEGEWTLLDIINTIVKGKDLACVRGITYRNNGNVIINPQRPLGPIDELPIMNYELMPDEFVKNMEFSVVSSRGCAYKCAYCNESLFWGNKVRQIPVEHIIQEITQLVDNYGNYPRGLEDSMFDMRMPYFFKLCSGLAQIELDPLFHLFSRVDSVTEKGLDAMLDAGIKHIFMGIESASPKVLNAMNKGISIQKAEEACAKAAQKGILVSTFWMIGHPGDSPEEAEITINAIDRFYRQGITHSSEIAIFIPYPGSLFFKDPGRFGIEILNYDWEKWGRFYAKPVCELKEFSKEEIFQAWKKAKAIEEKWPNLYNR